MESIRIRYKNDDYANPIYARVSWSAAEDLEPKPIALIYHGGGLLIGSSEIIPPAQTAYLASQGFVIVTPNYRLCPQVSVKEVVADCEEAFEWAMSTLPGVLETDHGVRIDTAKIVALGHSSGGALALQIGASKAQVKAVTAFYPTLYASDSTTSGHQPYTLPPFGTMPSSEPTEAEWASIAPPNHQLSEWQLPKPGTIPPPRNKWQVHLLKNGLWLKAICPDGDYTSLDPATKLHANWPATMIVQGEVDRLPGSSLDLAVRAGQDMRTAGVREVEIEIVKGADHMFDLTLSAAEGDEKWEAVKKGLDWLVQHLS